MNAAMLCITGLMIMICMVNSKLIREEKEVTLRMKKTRRTATLRCEKGEVIHDVQVNSYTRSKGGNRCHGLQPSALVSANNCYWSRRCRLAYSNREPIVVTNITSCLGRRPKQLKLSYSCIEIDRVIFIHDEAEADHTVRVESSNYGLIVSHTQFPWQYRPGVEAEVILKPANTNFRFLHLTVMSIDLEQHDRAEFKTERSATWTPLAEAKNINMMATQARFRLFTDRTPFAASGFLLCFYWTYDALSEEDMCNKVRNPGKLKE